jgi:Na+-driven multidrug efflux pump
MLLNVLKLGFSSFLTQASIVIVSIVSMNMLAKYGMQSKYGSDDPQAIMGIVMKVFTIVINIAVGIAAGAQPIIGYNYGAKYYSRVKKLLSLILILNLILGVIATLLFELLPGQIIQIFGSNTQNKELYLEFGVLTIRIYLAFIIFTLIQKVTAIYLQAVGEPVKATILSLFRDVIIIIPSMIILPKFLGITGILYSSWVTDIISIIITVIFLIFEYKKLNKSNY